MGRKFDAFAAVIYFLLATSTILLASDGRSVAPVWPANAVLLAIVLDVQDRRRWTPTLVAGFVANVAANSVTRGLGVGPFLYGACNLIEVTVAAALLQPTLGDRQILGSLASSIRFMTVAGCLAPMSSAIAGALTAWTCFGEPFGRSFFVWLLGDGLGLVLFVPVFRAALRGEYSACFRSRTWKARIEAVTLQAGTGALAYAVFFLAPRPLLFVLFAPVMLITVRMGRLGTKLAVMVIGTVGALATLRGVGPISAMASDTTVQAFSFQAYLATLLLTCLPAAADLTAQRTEVHSLKQRTDALEVRRVELSHLAERDELTGVLNRRAFRDSGMTIIEAATTTTSLIALDLDKFKDVNDRHGHGAGDLALCHLAEVLRSGLRDADVIGRIGGDEFLVLLPSTTFAEASCIAQRLAQAFADAPLLLGQGISIPLSMSVGVASFEDGTSWDNFVKAADLELYRNKADKSRLAAVA